MEGIQYIGLKELQRRIKGTVTDSFHELLWVRGEISEIKSNVTGHCYMTLTEKDNDSNMLQAKASAIIWASTYRLLKPFFESETGASLSVGMEILVKVQVQYSELYGLSLIICDIDPSFTVGEMELQRKKDIEKLEAEGMFDLNSSLPLPRIPRKFALISSPTAAGYRDFVRQLECNDYGYRFHITLFEALMQGNDAPGSIISALDNIAESLDEFDAVLVLRGGGGAMDLACFDNYELAVNVAQFPIPVMTGVGHDHDYHIIDMVAHTHVKTPTALADFIVSLCADEEFHVDSLAQRMHLALKGKFGVQTAGVVQFLMRIKAAATLRNMTELHKIEALESRMAAANPQEVLGKGYALVLKEGRRVGSVSELKTGDRLTIMLKDGNLEATI